MSCALTSEQVLAELKDVTRRLGWLFLKPGDILNLVNKTMGFKKGEHPVKYKTVRVLSVRPEPLSAITKDEVRREGFPDKSPQWFIKMFCRTHKGCTPDTIVTRIEWEYI
jgi:hypothetical protein